jgi:hypothetical protein
MLLFIFASMDISNSFRFAGILFFSLSAGEKKLNKHRTTFHAAIREC